MRKSSRSANLKPASAKVFLPTSLLPNSMLICTPVHQGLKALTPLAPSGHGPGDVPGSEVEWPDRVIFAVDDLYQDARTKDVLALLVKPDAFPRHDGAGAVDVGFG